MNNQNVGNYTGILSEDAKIIAERTAQIIVEQFDGSEDESKKIKIPFKVTGELFERVTKKGKKGSVVSIDYKLGADNGSEINLPVVITTNVDFFKSTNNAPVKNKEMMPTTKVYVVESNSNDLDSSVDNSVKTVSNLPSGDGWTTEVKISEPDAKHVTFKEIINTVAVDPGNKELDENIIKVNTEKTIKTSKIKGKNKKNHENKKAGKVKKLPAVSVIEIDNDGEKINTAETAAKAVFQQFSIVKAEKLASLKKDSNEIENVEVIKTDRSTEEKAAVKMKIHKTDYNIDESKALIEKSAINPDIDNSSDEKVACCS